MRLHDGDNGGRRPRLRAYFRTLCKIVLLHLRGGRLDRNAAGTVRSVDDFLSVLTGCCSGSGGKRLRLRWGGIPVGWCTGILVNYTMAAHHVMVNA